MKVLIDTSVLTRIANGRRDVQFDVAVAAVERLRERGHRPVVVPQVLYEFWVVVTRPRVENGLGLSAVHASAELDRLAPPLFAVLQDERAILPRWKSIVLEYSIQGKTAHDARLVAGMLRHGLTAVMSFNIRHFARFRGITSFEPADVAAGRTSP